MHRLGTFFNASFGVNHQEEIQEWMQDHHPDIWRELEAGGVVEDEMGNRKFTAIDRTLHA